MKFLIMKKLLCLLVLSIAFTSCTFVEEIDIQPDGSGKYNLDMDGSSLMSMIPKDSLKNEKNVDSTFSFKKMFSEKKDSIAKLSPEEQAKLKRLENFNMRMKMNYDTKQFLFSMNTDFKKVSDLQDAFGNLNSVQSLGKNKMNQNTMGDTGGLFGSNTSKLTFFYDGKKFIRKSVVDTELLKKVKNDSAQQAYEMIYQASKYVLKYHFPKKVKRISINNALYSEDRKTITIEYPFKEYMDHPEKFNFEVEFENSK